MLKKVISILCIFSYVTTFSAATIPLSPTETEIYNALKREYPNINNSTEINNFLEKKHIPAQQLSNILTRKLSLLNDEEKSLKSLNESTIFNLMMPTGPMVAHAPMGVLAYLGAITASLIYGIPTLAIGLAVKQFATPSPTQKTISSGLIGIGGLLSIPATLAGLTFTASEIELFLKKIIYNPQKINNQLTEINEEKNICYKILNLIKQPTTFL